MNKVVKIFICIIALFCILIAGVMFAATRGLSEGAEMAIQNINPQTYEDGDYQGIYKKGRWLSEVRVTVKSQKITKIELLSAPMLHPGKPDFSRELFNRVIEKQNLDVDVISGATVTSKAYLKSIENALSR